MQRVEPPYVRAGQRVTAALFEQLRRAVLACRLVPGPGVKMRWTPAGTIISFDPGKQSFAHPWQVSLRGDTAATVRPGTVNKVPATIKGKPLDGGEAGDAPPLLEFGKPKVDSRGRGFICVEVTLDPVDRFAVKKAEIVQVADPDTPTGDASGGLANASGGSLPIPGNRARQPLAMLVLRNDGRLDVYQVTFFDLEHRVKLAADLKTAARHFFY